jgi:hypothetical protein
MTCPVCGAAVAALRAIQAKRTLRQRKVEVRQALAYHHDRTRAKCPASYLTVEKAKALVPSPAGV